MKYQNILKRGGVALMGLAMTLILSPSQAEERQVDVDKLPPAATKTGVTYAKDIKPIFDKSCTGCHGEKRDKARLRLDSLEHIMAGSKHGAVVVPGKSEKSMLLRNIANLPGDEDDWMPPKDNKAKIAPLTKEQVSLVRAWVEQGAK